MAKAIQNAQKQLLANPKNLEKYIRIKDCDQRSHPLCTGRYQETRPEETACPFCLGRVTKSELELI